MLVLVIQHHGENLNIGDCSVANSNGAINFENVMQLGMNEFYVFCIGDNENPNNNTNTQTNQMGVWYYAPSSSLAIGPTGKVVM
jgi:hypothetical protein